MIDAPSAGDRHMFTLIGVYMLLWSSFELAVDIAITKLSGDTAAQVVRKTGGKAVADKVKFLRKLVEENEHPQSEKILHLLDVIPSQSIRNSIAHSYMRFGSDKVIFVHRKSTSQVAILEFTTAEFHGHISQMSSLTHEVSEIFGNSDADAENFMAAVVTP